MQIATPKRQPMASDLEQLAAKQAAELAKLDQEIAAAQAAYDQWIQPQRRLSELKQQRDRLSLEHAYALERAKVKRVSSAHPLIERTKARLRRALQDNMLDIANDGANAAEVRQRAEAIQAGLERLERLPLTDDDPEVVIDQVWRSIPPAARV